MSFLFSFLLLLLCMCFYGEGDRGTAPKSCHQSFLNPLAFSIFKSLVNVNTDI